MSKPKMINAEELLTWIHKYYSEDSEPKDWVVAGPICERIRLMAYGGLTSPTNFRNPGWESRATENGETK